MKKIFLLLIVILATMSINAQVIKVLENGVLSAAYANTPTNTVDVVLEDAPEPILTDENLLPGKFSVSKTKQVQFTKSNLYWDGSNFKFEANPTDFPTDWNSHHVGHFYWTTASGGSHNEYWTETEWDYSDKFFADGSDASHMLTVEGTSGLYVLSKAEWRYLIERVRKDESNLYINGVTVTNGGTEYKNCLIIAPDDFEGEFASSYTLDEVNAAGFVCLPAAGERSMNNFYECNSIGYYWSATLFDYSIAYVLCIQSYYSPNAGYIVLRDVAHSIRLVRGL